MGATQPLFTIPSFVDDQISVDGFRPAQTVDQGERDGGIWLHWLSVHDLEDDANIMTGNPRQCWGEEMNAPEEVYTDNDIQHHHLAEGSQRVQGQGLASAIWELWLMWLTVTDRWDTVRSVHYQEFILAGDSNK